MGTEILQSFSNLQSELEEARNSLKGVDENIKRLIGRDPSELPPRPGLKRALDEKNSRPPFSKSGRFEGRFEQRFEPRFEQRFEPRFEQRFEPRFEQRFEPRFEGNDLPKRRNPNSVSVFKRLSDKVPDESITPSKGLISKVIAAPKEIPSRQEALDKQNKDEKFKARNRRMFGALLGTLQKFQQDECKLKKREDKRTQIEKKIEEHEQQEKAEIKKERQELFQNRKRKQQEIKMIELKMLRMKEYAAWEQSQKPRAHFIATKAKPHIMYLPRRMNDQTNELLEKSKQEVEEHIAKRKQAVAEELSHIEDRMKRNFEPRVNTVESKVERTNDRHNRRGSDSENEMDDDIVDEEPKEKSPSPEPEEKEKQDEEVPNSVDGNEEQQAQALNQEMAAELPVAEMENGTFDTGKEEVLESIDSVPVESVEVTVESVPAGVYLDEDVEMTSVVIDSTSGVVVVTTENTEVSGEVVVNENEQQMEPVEDI